jgi:carboxyl-terminal processing protease
MGFTRAWLIVAACASLLLLGGVFLMRNKSLPDLTALNGVWRSQGYGWVWAITDGRLRTYEESGPYCIETADAGHSRERLGEGYKLSSDGKLLTLPLDDPAYRFTFERLGALPDACARRPAADPASVIDAMDRIFTAHYAFFKTRKVDWPALIAAAKAEVTADSSEDELLAALGGLLAGIDDNHVTLRARVGGRKVSVETGLGPVLQHVADRSRLEGLDPDDMIERWRDAVWKSQKQLLGSMGRTVANGNVKFGLIDSDIGFLSILSMDDFDPGDDDAEALDDALDKAMELFQGASAVIVDVTVNDGGQDVLARRIAERFADKRTLAYSKYAGDARAASPQAIYLQPSARPRFTGPVYLLTSNVTLSAAEVFTVAMRSLPNVTHAGQATRGCLSDELTKRLPNGWRLTLSNEVYLDSAGKAWEGRGVPPRIPISVFTEDAGAVQTYLQAVRTLIDRIRSR